MDRPKLTLKGFFAAAALCVGVAVLWPAPAFAQRRGHPVRVRASVVVAPVYLGAGYYDPYWWDWGYRGWYPPVGPPGFGYESGGSARLQVTPKQAEVYVDGYLAGSVDDFDGFFQRLDVPPGEHELTLYLEGYETYTQKVLFRPGTTLDIRYTLRPLAAGQTSGPRPSPPPEPPPPPDVGRGPGPETRGPMPMPGRRGPWGPGPGREPGPDAPADGPFGTLAVRVQPHDAALYVDGEEWSAPEGDGPILIELLEGSHEVEVRKDGLTTYRRTIQVRPGRTVSLNVSLSR